MKDYEMYDGEEKKGTINIFWDNVTLKHKSSIIESIEDKKYKIVDINDDGQKYELYFNINDIDDIYDIVSKYISDDKQRFIEIDKIKELNNIKNIKKTQSIKILLPKNYLKFFNKSIKDLDKNSIINSKIYFITKACENNKLEKEKKVLDNIIKYFNNIINSNEYVFYDDKEKNNFQDKAIDNLNKLIKQIEETTNYKYGKHFIKNIKVN